MLLRRLDGGWGQFGHRGCRCRSHPFAKVLSPTGHCRVRLFEGPVHMRLSCIISPNESYRDVALRKFANYIP
jgi:hypothetical protein